MMNRANVRPTSPAHAEWEVEVFYDGDCPLCMREINMLKRMDRGARILFRDLTQLDLPTDADGKTRADLMARIQARLPDGSWIEGVEVFRRLYAAVGFRRAVAMSRWPLIRQLLDLAYQVFARNRLRLTGRCEDGACTLPVVESST